MDFISYLSKRHSIVPSARQIKELSAHQYNGRLKSMIEQNIYCDGNQIDKQTVDKINVKYANKTGEYERTIKYYLEYKEYLNK